MTQVLPLSCDWLALSLDLKTMVSGCPKGHRWLYYSPTNVWGSRWCLYNDYGDKVFTLLFQPCSGIIRKTAALLEVANEWLYHGLGKATVLDLLGECVDYEITGISRLDLAVDFNPTRRQTHIIKGLSSDKYYVQGKRNGSGFWSTNRDEFYPPQWRGTIPHCQSWGHKTSDVRWKLYYKTKELRDAAGGKGFEKPYIVDMWREVGLDESNVWRLEVSVHNCNNFEFLGNRLSFDEYMHSGEDLFKALYDARFQIRRNQGHKDRSNDTLCNLLDIGSAHKAFRTVRRDTLAEHNGRLSLLRHLVSDVYTESVLVSDEAREAVIVAVQQIVNNDNLHRYFEQMTGQTLDDWIEWIRVKAYYFGEEYRIAIKDRGQTTSVMEMAMVNAGLVRDTTEDEISEYRWKKRAIMFDDLYKRRYNRLRHLENLTNQIRNIREN